MSDTESIPESTAIKALGSLFKITGVSLWDAAKTSLSENFSCIDFGTDPAISDVTTASNSSMKNEIADYMSLNDLEIAEKMDALGLPTSFHTTKQYKNSISIKRKKNVINTVDASSDNDKENIIPESPRNCIMDENQPKVLHHKTDTHLDNMNPELIHKSTNSQGDKGSSNVDDDVVVEAIVDEETDVNMSNYAETNCIEGSSIACLSKGENVYDNVGEDINNCSTSVCGEYGNWRIIWDPYYERNYFYNIQSTESTWYPPQGLESFAANSSEADVIDTVEEHTGVKFACDAMQDIDLCGPFEKEESAVNSNKSSEETIVYAHSANHEIVKKVAGVQDSLHEPTDLLDELDAIEYWDKQERNISEACGIADASPEPLVNNSLSFTVIGRNNNDDSSNSLNMGGTSLMVEIENICEIASKKTKKKKKQKKKRRVRRLMSQLSLLEEEGVLPAHINKYWCQRYSLFSRFDCGIKMDEEGWFSVTPESIARHHAARCGHGTIVDCFTGVGGNAIQFAIMGNHVIAIDIDSMRIDCAEQNAAVYGVNDRINFIIGDFFQIAHRLKADVIFMSPPWGGPDYNKVETYDINTMLKPRDGQHLFEIARTIASKVVMFLPRNADINQLAEISLSVSPPWTLEVEKNYLNGRFKAITAYFSKPVL